MYTDSNVSNLMINQLTLEKYEELKKTGEVDLNQIYLVFNDAINGYEVIFNGNETGLKATNVQDALNEIYEFSAENFANAIKHDQTGKVIHADNISPVQSIVRCEVESKNLVPRAEVIRDPGSITVAKIFKNNGILIDGGVPFTFSVQNKNLKKMILYAIYKSGGSIKTIDTNTEKIDLTFVLTEKSLVYFQIYCPDGIDDEVMETVQLEKGVQSSEFTSYVDDLTTIKLYARGSNLCNYKDAFSSEQTQTLTIDEQNNSIIFSGKGYFKIPFIFPVNENIKLNLSSEKTIRYKIEYDDQSISDFIELNAPIKLSKMSSAILVYKNNPDISEDNIVFKNIICSVADYSGGYKDYRGDILSPETSGEIKHLISYPPRMTLFTNNIGVVIHAIYNLDVTAYIANALAVKQNKENDWELIETINITTDDGPLSKSYQNEYIKFAWIITMGAEGTGDLTLKVSDADGYLVSQQYIYLPTSVGKSCRYENFVSNGYWDNTETAWDKNLSKSLPMFTGWLSYKYKKKFRSGINKFIAGGKLPAGTKIEVYGVRK